ncbi:unnamed protein product [Tuber melanosporum]|uniref:(Perigord truffle) hypothetical protein n=1 Tax=Tuber melanosporum (strain Mel28) TaxID=656061 RepID=D5GD96_TUBMM|nr:uncharacterized protein GSTUM_00006104001 [Tuber melanosporum]CAZ82489.1 unnamed protein product [Tuber melanosporum]
MVTHIFGSAGRSTSSTLFLSQFWRVINYDCINTCNRRVHVSVQRDLPSRSRRMHSIRMTRTGYGGSALLKAYRTGLQHFRGGIM